MPLEDVISMDVVVDWDGDKPKSYTIYDKLSSINPEP
jgi:hypothetical protein